MAASIFARRFFYSFAFLGLASSGFPQKASGQNNIQVGEIRGSEQIIVPKTIRAYEDVIKPDAMEPADGGRAKVFESTLKFAFGEDAAKLTGEISQNGDTLYASGTLFDTKVDFQAAMDGEGLFVHQIIADYPVGLAFSRLKLPGVASELTKAFYLPDFILNKAELDTYTVTLISGVVSSRSLGFEIPAEMKILDDFGLTLLLKDVTLAMAHDDRTKATSGTLGGTLVVGFGKAATLFSINTTLAKDPKLFAVSGVAQNIDFIEMLKALAPQKTFDGLPIPIDSLSQFTTVDLAKISVNPFNKEIDFYATSPLAAIEFSYRPNEVRSKDAKPDPHAISAEVKAANPNPAQLETRPRSKPGSSIEPPKPEPEAAKKEMGFMLGIEPLPSFKMASVIPALAILDQLNVAKVALIYSSFTGEASPDTNLEIFKTWSPTTTISPGLSALLVVDASSLKDIHLDRSLAKIGLSPKLANSVINTVETAVRMSPVKQLVFRAHVPKQISAFELELLATLSTPRIGGVFDFREVNFSLKPLATTAQFGGVIDLKLPKYITSAERLIFTGGIGYEAPTTAFITGAMISNITDLFGIKGLRIDRAGFSAGLNFEADGIPIPDNIELTGGLGMSFGPGQVVFDDASFLLAIDINKPENLALRFNLEKLSWRNLIQGFAGSKSLTVFDKTPVLKDVLKSDLEELNVQLIAPGFTFTSATGETYTGTHFSGRGKIAGIKGAFSITIESLQNPLIATVSLDPIRLPKIGGIDSFVLTSYDGKSGPHATIDLTLSDLEGGLQKPLIEIDGSLTLLGSKSATKLSFNGKEFSGVSDGTLYGLFDAKTSFTTPSFENPLSTLHVKAEVEVEKLGKKIMGKVTQAFTGFALKLKRFDFEGNLGDLHSGATADVLVHVNPPVGDSFDHDFKIKFTPKGLGDLAADVAKEIVFELGKVAKKVARVVVKEVVKIADDAARVLTGGPNAWGKTLVAILHEVEDVFDQDNRKRIKLDGPQFRAYHKASGLLLRPAALDGKSSAYLAASQGSSNYEETWQIVPSKDPEYFFLVTGWDGQNINVEGSSKDENGQVWIRKHKKSGSDNEKLKMIPVPNEPGMYYMQFKHSGKYLYARQGASSAVQSSLMDDGAKWSFKEAGQKVWAKSASAPTGTIPADAVVLFLEEIYKGNWLALHIGKNQLGAPFANETKSIQIPVGLIATVYDKVDCTGKQLEMTASRTTLATTGLKGDIACVMVKAAPLAPISAPVQGAPTPSAPAPVAPALQATFFLDGGFRGAQLSLPEGTHVFPSAFKNKVSSLKIPSGLSVTLIDKDNCESNNRITLTTDETKLTKLNNNAACVLIQRR